MNFFFVQLAYKIDVKGRNCVQSVREALIRRWRLRFELKVKHPSRSSGSSHHFDGVRLRFGNLVSKYRQLRSTLIEKERSVR